MFHSAADEAGRWDEDWTPAACGGSEGLFCPYMKLERRENIFGGVGMVTAVWVLTTSCRELTGSLTGSAWL